MSYKGGLPGFVRVLDACTLAFPSYDGNAMFKSPGNVFANPHVGLLFIDFEKPNRLRVTSSAAVSDDDPLLEQCEGAQLMVRLTAEHIFDNCPRYIHRMQIVETSPYAPGGGKEPPVPKWKRFPEFRDVLPKGDKGGT